MDPGNDSSVPYLDHFRSSQVTSGSFEYQFDIQGVYYYQNYPVLGLADFSGEVKVRPRLSIQGDVSVSVGRFSTYFDNSYFEFGNSVDYLFYDYNVNFTYSLRTTPEVLSFYGSWASPNDEIFIYLSLVNSSSNFTFVTASLESPNESNYPCYIHFVSDDMISCQLDITDEPPVGVPFQLYVNVFPYGKALIASPDGRDRITFYPEIFAVFPPSVSIVGGAVISIFGYGFSGYPSVEIGSYSCLIVDFDYLEIRCLAPDIFSNQTETLSINVTVTLPDGETSLAVCNGDCNITYSYNSTVIFDSLGPSSVPGTPNSTIIISGSLLQQYTNSTNVNESTITVYFAPYISSFSYNEYTEYYLLLLNSKNSEVFRKRRSLSHITRSTLETDTNGDVLPSCSEIVFMDGMFSCVLPELSAGQYATLVKHSVYGYAVAPNDTIPDVTVELVVESITPSAGSTAGGTVIALSGGGFSESLEDISVFLNGSVCAVTAVSFHSVTCVTPSHTEGLVKGVIRVLGIPAEFSYNYSSDATPFIESVSPTVGNFGDNVTLNVSNVASESNLTIHFGQKRCELLSVLYSNEAVQVFCEVPAYFVGMQAIRVWVNPFGFAEGEEYFEYVLVLEDVTPKQGSFAGQSELVIIGRGFDPVDVRVEVCGLPCTPSLKQPSISEISCILPEISKYTPGSGEVLSCSVLVTTSGVSKTLYGAFNYSDELTPLIKEVTPTQGGSAGGTFIIIEGYGFENENVTVTIAETPCNISEQNSSHITCRTGASRRTVTSQVEVYVEGKGLAYSANPVLTRYRYVDLWSSVYTWNGSRLPEEGDFVIVPKGQTLSLDVHTPVLKILLIDGGTLLFDDNQNVTLRAENILIVNDGVFQVSYQYIIHTLFYLRHLLFILYTSYINNLFSIFGFVI